VEAKEGRHLDEVDIPDLQEHGLSAGSSKHVEIKGMMDDVDVDLSSLLSGLVK